jgi:hypothetical protein
MASTSWRRLRRKLLPRNVLDLLRGVGRGYKDGGLVQPVQFPRFNLGGMADAAMHSLDALRPQPMGTLALAGIGGSPQSTTPVHLNFGNGDTVVMQTVSDEQVLHALHRVAQGQKRRSLGSIY